MILHNRLQFKKSLYILTSSISIPGISQTSTVWNCQSILQIGSFPWLYLFNYIFLFPKNCSCIGNQLWQLCCLALLITESFSIGSILTLSGAPCQQQHLRCLSRIKILIIPLFPWFSGILNGIFVFQYLVAATSKTLKYSSLLFIKKSHWCSICHGFSAHMK